MLLDRAKRACLSILCLVAAAGTGWSAYALMDIMLYLGPPLWIMLFTVATSAQFAAVAGVMVIGAWRTLREG